MKKSLRIQQALAQERKGEIETYERKKNVFLLHKWSIIRKKKLEMVENKMHEVSKAGRAQVWAQRVLIDKVIRHVYEAFSRYKSHKLLSQKRERCSSKIQRFF